MSAFARRLPVDHLLVMMGAPPERRDAFVSWVNKTFRAVTVTVDPARGCQFAAVYCGLLSEVHVDVVRGDGMYSTKDPSYAYH